MVHVYVPGMAYICVRGTDWYVLFSYGYQYPRAAQLVLRGALLE
jgi:hypothetical protein